MSNSIFVKIEDILPRNLELVKKKIKCCNYSFDGDQGIIFMEKDIGVFCKLTGFEWKKKEISDGFYELELTGAIQNTKEDTDIIPKINIKNERENIVNICYDYVNDKIKTLTNIAEKAKKDIDELKHKLEVESKRSSISSYNLLKISKNNRYSEEFDNLLKIKSIKNIVVHNDGVTVWTNMIYCKDDRHDTIHEIGEFKINISFDEDTIDEDDSDYNNIVRYENLTRKVDNNEFKKMNAPHVFGAGDACWGNHYKLIKSLAEKNEVIPLILQSIRFLEAANTDDPAGSQVCSWPYKGEKPSAYKRRITDRVYNCDSICGDCKFSHRCNASN